MTLMIAPVELTDLELDAVAGGQPRNQPAIDQVGEGLAVVQVAAPINVQNVQVGVSANVLTVDSVSEVLQEIV
jgi:hypothetical protein